MGAGKGKSAGEGVGGDGNGAGKSAGKRAGDGQGAGKRAGSPPHSRHQRRKILEGIRGEDTARKEMYVAGGYRKTSGSDDGDDGELTFN